MHDRVNTIHHADCLEILAQLPPSSIHLAYLDPPFMTNRTHVSPRDAESESAKTRIRATKPAFADHWPSLTDYLDFLRARIALIHRALHDTGSILVHCDWRTCHHLRLLLDEIFGPERFVNHLIWWYGLGGSSPRRFARKHDDILFYARSENYHFDPPRIPATSNRMRGQTKKATDVLAIPSINNQAHERTGYPTQKPLALLELLVRAGAPRDAIVLDPFCGSGTTCLAAHSLGRRYIGIDISPDAVRIARERLTGSAASAAAHTDSKNQNPPVRMSSSELGNG